MWNFGSKRKFWKFLLFFNIELLFWAILGLSWPGIKSFSKNAIIGICQKVIMKYEKDAQVSICQKKKKNKSSNSLKNNYLYNKIK